MIKGMDEGDWDILIDNINRDECTPLIGPEACRKALPQFCGIAQDWASRHGYPLQDSDDLARVAEYLAIHKNRPMAPKEMIRELLCAQPQIDFDADDEPHGVLADLPLSVYITTNYDDCMTWALARKRKPRRELCKWNKILAREKFPLDSDYEPSVSEPLVFYMLGHYSNLQSLVLTEDDYLDFLVNIAGGRHDLPALIQDKLTRTSLLFIGYRLTDWSFRVLLRSLTVDQATDSRPISVTVQMPSNGDTPEQPAVERYLDEYFKLQNLQVVWGTAGEFVQELGRRCRVKGIRVPDSTADAAASLSTPVTPGQLHDILKNKFSRHDLADLCRNLGINYEALEGDGTAVKAGAIVDDFMKHDRLPELIAYVKKERPDCREFQQ